MKRDLFRRYVWLVDTIRHATKITYEEISNLWKNSTLNTDHSPLALRTFHNHRDAIENLFGIRILCDRSDHHRYYIADNNMEPTKLKVWMLQTLSLSNMIEASGNVENRIVLDMTPDERFGLSTAIEAMKKNFKLNLVYSIPTAGNRTEFIIGPYCVRFWNNNWYLLGKCDDTGEMLVFDFARILSIVMLKEPFVYDSGFSPSEFFRNYYGMEITPDLNPVQIRIKVYGKTRDIIRTLPLHVTQKEILADFDSSIFEYFFVPSPDFKQTVLSMGTDVEVISPLELRREIKDQILRMASCYETEANYNLNSVNN